jgi:hypothetical protein
MCVSVLATYMSMVHMDDWKMSTDHQGLELYVHESLCGYVYGPYGWLENINRSPGIRVICSWLTMWILQIEPGSFAITSALNHWACSLAYTCYLTFKRYKHFFVSVKHNNSNKKFPLCSNFWTTLLPAIPDLHSTCQATTQPALPGSLLPLKRIRDLMSLRSTISTCIPR